MTAQLQQISDMAWIVYKDDQETGILNKDVQDHYTYINGSEFVRLNDDREVKKHFGNSNIFDEQISAPPASDIEFFIQGHRVHYHDPYPLDVGHPDYNPNIPLYAKTPTSDIYYAAGWFCVHFDKCWKHGNGTKYTTLQKYGFEGPYKTFAECKDRLKVLNAGLET